jgi:membrane protein YdbS with pleckstrin-like domain
VKAAGMGVTARAAAETPGGLTLSPAERVVLTMHPWWAAWLLGYVLTLGLCEFWRRRNYLMVTNQRVFVGHGIVFIKTQQSIPLDKVQDASYARRFWIGRVQISSAGGSLGTLRLGGYRPARAREFVNEVNALRQSHLSASSADHVESLRHLATLRDEGILSQEEFEAKKAEILARI